MVKIPSRKKRKRQRTKINQLAHLVVHGRNRMLPPIRAKSPSWNNRAARPLRGRLVLLLVPQPTPILTININNNTNHRHHHRHLLLPNLRLTTSIHKVLIVYQRHMTPRIPSRNRTHVLNHNLQRHHRSERVAKTTTLFDLRSIIRHRHQRIVLPFARHRQERAIVLARRLRSRALSIRQPRPPNIHSRSFLAHLQDMGQLSRLRRRCLRCRIPQHIIL